MPPIKEGNIPANDLCVTRNLIDHNARERPDLVMLKFGNGETTFTCLELHNHVIAHAAGLQRLGVQQGDYVLSWLPNGPMAVTMLLALNYIGAIYVPINIAYRGGLLQHVIENSGATLMIADGRLIEKLSDINTAKLSEIVVIGPERPPLKNIVLIAEAELTHPEAVLQTLPREIQAYDTHIVIFTSGTTGPSKGVLCSNVHTYTSALEFRHIGPGDCNLVVLPMFHIGGVLGIYFAMIHGGTAAVVDSFHTQTFWQTVQELDVTTVGLLGAMVQFLMKQPALPHERDHSIRTAVIAPFNDDAIAFGKRFGVEVFTEYNMTELSVPLYCGPNPTVRGTCGKPRAGLELRLVDNNDLPVKPGAIGELIVRMEMPWSISHGYLNNPQATAETWRNGWFHSGDLFYKDADDNYFFVDRAKDAIRRRGENISSFEVEIEILAHPSIREAAVVATPGLGGEDDVLAVIAPMAGHTINPLELLEFIRPRLAHYMIPRYIRTLAELPKTPTQKVEKHRLRKQSITADTWDREAAGITIKRDKLTSR